MIPISAMASRKCEVFTQVVFGVVRKTDHQEDRDVKPLRERGPHTLEEPIGLHLLLDQATGLLGSGLRGICHTDHAGAPEELGDFCVDGLGSSARRHLPRDLQAAIE